jgi:hypothetical protein
MGGEKMIFEPITVTNILEKRPEELAGFLNTHVLSNKLPIYTANHQVSVSSEIVPRLSKYANDKAYVTELYNIVIAQYFKQKSSKRNDKDNYNDSLYVELDAKKEILYRTMQALEGLYEAASRIMTGIGEPDPRLSRHP